MPDPELPAAGFAVLENAVHATVFEGTSELGGYNHHCRLTWHKDCFYALWSNHPYGEDAPGMRVLFSRSEDGIRWESFNEAFPPPGPVRRNNELGAASSAGGWLTTKDRLYAMARVAVSTCFRSNPTLGPSVSTVYDDVHLYPHGFLYEWIAREIREDWTLGPLIALGDNVPDDIAYKLVPADSPLAKPVIHQRTQILDPENVPVGSNKPGLDRPRTREGHRLSSPTLYRTRDCKWIMLFRYRFNHRMYVSFFDQAKVAWSEARPTDIPDSPSNTATVRTRNGEILLIGNQMAPKFDNAKETLHYDRDPLTIAVSRDGYRFDRVSALRCGTKTGKYRVPGLFGRAGGAQEPSILLHKGRLCALYSIGKEDIGFSMVALEELGI